LRTVGFAGLALVVGLGIGSASGAGADQPRAAIVSKTLTSCLLALESAWKVINRAPSDSDQRAEFDTTYAECLQAD
jgi:hypothetical protein